LAESLHLGSQPIAANVFTPDVIGGKIVLIFWYEDACKEVDAIEIDPLVGLKKGWTHNNVQYSWFFHIGWLSFTALGPFMMLKWLCFAPKKEFLLRGPVECVNGGTTPANTAK